MGENDPGILVNAAFVLAHFGEDIGAMIGLVDRALALNPSFARGWFVSGNLRSGPVNRSRDRACRDLAAPEPARAYRCAPNEIGVAYFFKRQFDEAASKLLLAIQDNPGFPTPYRILAACYAHMGHLDEARATSQGCGPLPLRSCRAICLRNPEDRELFLSGLRLAAGEANEPDPPSRHDPRGDRANEGNRSLGADTSEPAGRLDDCRYRVAVPGMRADDYGTTPGLDTTKCAIWAAVRR